MDFQTVKSECIALQKKVDQLYSSVCTNVFLRDLESLSKEHPEFKKENNNYSIMGISFKPNDQSIRILDERGTAFLWIFDLQFKSELCLGDTIAFKDDYFQIRNLENFDSLLLPELNRMKDRYEQTIGWLQSNTLPKTSEYLYYSDHENIECPCIEDVLKTVIAREATN